LWTTKTIFSAAGDGLPVPEDSLDAAEVVRKFGGTASSQQILQYSTQHSIRLALGSGALRRVARGRYALTETALAEQVAAATQGLVSHGSAAQHWKLEMLSPPDSAHVTVPPHARPRPRTGATLHFADVPAVDDHGGVTSPVRTVLDCARELPLGEALSIADSALRIALVTPEDLIVAAHQRRGPGRRRIIQVVEAASALAANPFESGLRGIVIEAGIEGFEPQCPIQLPSGKIYVDLGDWKRRIAFEADSYAFHMSPEALLKDCRRYNELISAGWLILRFGWQHVLLEAAWVTAMIKQTCALREMSPPGSV
jgi:very-short-patch-repair endonuclease